MLCVAPAGSGKTTTLVARICWLVGLGAHPGRVTAVTFNKRAADELGERLATALEPLGVVEPPVRVRTFHALGREILADAGVSVRNLVDRSEALTSINGRPLSARSCDGSTTASRGSSSTSDSMPWERGRCAASRRRASHCPPT